MIELLFDDMPEEVDLDGPESVADVPQSFNQICTYNMKGGGSVAISGEGIKEHCSIGWGLMLFLRDIPEEGVDYASLAPKDSAGTDKQKWANTCEQYGLVRITRERVFLTSKLKNATLVPTQLQERSYTTRSKLLTSSSGGHTVTVEEFSTAKTVFPSSVQRLLLRHAAGKKLSTNDGEK